MSISHGHFYIVVSRYFLQCQNITSGHHKVCSDGVADNIERLTRVTLTNDTMAITWRPRNKTTGKPLQKTPMQRQIKSYYLELASGLHVSKMVQVVAAS